MVVSDVVVSPGMGVMKSVIVMSESVQVELPVASQRKVHVSSLVVVS